MSNENSKLLSTLASNVDSSTTSQSFSSCLTNTGEKNDLKEFKDAETELKEDSETELKDLLEEAYSYKTPGDKKNKSKKFLQLLHEVESETEDNGKFPQSLTRYGTASSQYHHSQSHGGHQKYGGSLQNLVDIDCSNHSLKGRRHFISLGGNQFSRTKKSSSSSVSTRQREGGSLPSNVNNTNLDLRKDQLKHNLLHEVTKTTNTITTTTTTKECLHNSDTNTHTTGSIGLLTSSSSFVNSMADTVIDMEVDNIDEDICSYISNYAKSKPQKKSNDTGKTEFVEMIEQKHLVDEKITFSSLDRSTNLETLNRGLPLDDNYKSCTSVLEKGNSNARRTTAIVTTASSLSNALTEGFTAASTGINVSSIGTVSLKQYDENGNLNMAGNSPNGISGNTSNTSNNSQSQAKAKSTKRQKEKNVRVFKAGDIPCNCGDQDINILVSFINNDSSSNENKNKKIKKKDKEKDGKSNPVIQKSSSLEELRSCTKLTADDNDNVTLRNKGIKNPKSGSKAGNSNNNVIRKGERRSWGTEEIPYYNELTTEDTKPKKKTSDTKINKKDVYGTEIPTKVHSMESINSEPSDFLLVTKKKKPKKRQTMDDSNFTSSNHNYSTRSGVFATNNSSNNNTNTTKKSGQNNEFQSYRKENSNNSYDNSQSVNSQTGIPNQKSRRKSTSSMPPSDKSDLSDSDSVHSLPIESNKKSSQNTSIKQKNHHHQKNQPQSYAEITKRKKSQGNATIATTASTPTTTSTTTITTNDVGVNTSSTTILKEDSSSISSNIKTKPKTKHKPVIDFPELVPTSAPISTSNTTTPQISYSQSLVSPAAAAAAATVATTNNNNEALSATSPTSTTLSTNDCEFMQPKQMLHKSKSMDNESNSSSNSKHNNSQSSNNLLYNSIDQYPALEKTVKRSSNNNNNNNSTSGDSSTTTIINEQPKVSTSCAIDVKKKSTNTLFSSTSKKSKKLCPNTSMGNRNSNRPAVIIINDDPNRCETAKLSQFTFGDFKEDELKFLGTSEEPPFNMNSTLKSNQDINVSLESDNGYSSSLNQSAKTMNEEDTITTTDSQNSNNSSIRHININNTNNSSSKATNTVSLGNKMNKKIKTCSEIEDSLTSQVQIMPGSNAGLNFKFMENPADEDDEDEEYLEDEDDETNATTSTNIGDDDNDNANVNENNIEVDIRVINNNKSSCILSFKPPPTNILLPSHNDHIIDFIGSAWEEVIKSKVTLFLQK